MTDQTQVIDATFAQSDDSALAVQAILNQHPEIREAPSWLAVQAKVMEIYAPGSTPEEQEVFLMEAIAQDLDPRLREIMCISFGRVKDDRGNWVEKHVPYVGIAGVRKIASRTGRLNGTEGPFWYGPDGIAQEIWLDMVNPPIAASFTVWAKNAITGENMDRPFRGAVNMKRARTYKDKNGVEQLMGKWATDPGLMLAKCAEVEAYKRASLFTNVKLEVIERGFLEEGGYATIRESGANQLSPIKKLHAIGAARGLSHEQVRTAVQSVDPTITSLSEADEATEAAMDQTAELLEMMDAEGVARMAGVEPEDVKGEPAPVPQAAPEPPSDIEYIRPRTLEWLNERESRIDFRKLGDEWGAIWTAREIISEKKGQALCVEVAKCLIKDAPPQPSK